MLTQEAGRKAEDLALQYMLGQGLTLMQRNYSCRVGEIDLIMRDEAWVVFIEVRSRSSNQFGGGISSVTRSKKQKILKAASFYMMINQWYEQFPMRFDVISIDSRTMKITWIKDAFGADY